MEGWAPGQGHGPDLAPDFSEVVTPELWGMKEGTRERLPVLSG